MKLFFTIVSLFSVLSLSAQDPNFHIYLSFGQSNMAGNGTAADLTTQDLTVNNRFQVLRSANCFSGYGEWETAVPPLCRCSNVAIGPTDYFGRTMIENLPSQINVGVIVVAVGGSDIALFDKHNYASYVATAPSWMVNEINQYGGNPYGRLVELGLLAQTQGVIKGILFHQGESNTGQTTWPAKVKDVYDNLITDLSLDPAETPLLVGELVHSTEGGACGSHNSIIATMPSVIPNSHVISSLGLPCKSDNLHFTAPSYRTLGERYAQKMLELLPTIDPNFPQISITAPIESTEFFAPATIDIVASASDPNGTVVNVKFFNGSTELEEDISSPYSYSWTNVQAGTYTISAVATDNDGNQTTATTTITVNVPQNSYNVTPHIIPGIIQFEEFDVGGNGYAYYDDSPGTSVPDAPNYRPEEDVDIENCEDTNGGYNIGYSTAGEWLEYSVDIQTTGTYDIVIRAACDGDGRTVSLSYEDGTSIASDIAIPNTGGWQTWEDVTVSDIELEAGEQVIRLTIGDADYVNLNYMSFSTDTPPVIPPSIFITSPSDNDEFNSDQTISITADATATDATIVDVKFYAGSQLLFTDDSAPYSYEWSGMSAGTYQILAIATDSNNSEAEDEISVTVIDAPVSISLQAGWNLIGYPYIESADIASALSSIWNNVEIVKNDEAYYNTSQADFLNLLQTLEWGNGYLIKVSDDCELIW